MTQKVGKIVISVLLLCSIAFAGGLSAKQKEAKALVDKAAKLISAKGEEGLKQISKPDGGFYFKEKALYAFVYSDEAVMLAHPYKPGLIGKSYKGKPDVRGKKFRDEIVKVALEKGEGWTDYSYQKPGQKGIHSKTAYCKLVKVKGKNYVVVAGIYK